jgi:signal transduction histidine kinase
MKTALRALLNEGAAWDSIKRAAAKSSEIFRLRGTATEPRVWSSELSLTIGFALAYFAGAELGQALSVKPGNFATIWPPSGLYLVVLLVTPLIGWPRLIAAAAVANIASGLLHAQTAWVSLGFCLATTLEAAIGASLLRWSFSLPFTLGRLKNTIGLVGIAGLISAPCGAIVGALTVSIAFGAAFSDSWLTWWIADVLGILVFGPLAAAFEKPARLGWRGVSPWRILEASLFVGGTALAATVLLGLPPPGRAVTFALYPFLLWGVLRFGLGGGSGGLALVSVIAISSTLAGRGPFAAPALPLVDDIRLAQFFLGVTAISFLILAAIMHERDRAARQFGRLGGALHKAQSELAHINRVATIGQLTASIAHEVNQPIAAAVINAQAASRWLTARPPDLDQIRQALDNIVRDCKRAGDVIGGIHALIKKTPPRKDRFDLNEAIFEIITLTRSEVLRHGVSLRTQLAASLPAVEGDRIQLQQVIVNLILNAVEAMNSIDEGARKLRISTEMEAAGGVLVTVRDSGPGLAPTCMDRVFEAFYTTKPEGVGMGLAICRSIIEAHGGRLWAAANEPRGAVFQFSLPPESGATVTAEPAGQMLVA